ncbi:MAG: lipoyl synthase [Planctomycetes bacterium]|nr:lipoyl synthase [Planctomycetota bacterium]
MGHGFPPWLIKRLPVGQDGRVSSILEDLHLHTVCSEARCPNRAECFASGTATFLILGDVCTRDCRFCAVTKGSPRRLDPDEPSRIAEAVFRMRLEYAVITSVTRDDLEDGGAAHFAETVRCIRRVAGIPTEVLTPDFKGSPDAIDTVLAAGPAVFNHNIETVPRLYGQVRPKADYERSLAVLAHARRKAALVKSGLMLGFGETGAEVTAVLKDLRASGVAIVTMGQYLAPGRNSIAVAEYVHPDVFADYEKTARELGFRAVAAAPFVRSSFQAAILAESARSDKMQ